MTFTRVQFPVLCFIIFIVAMTGIIYMHSLSQANYWVLYGGLGFSLLAINNFFIYNIQKLLLITVVCTLACFISGLLISEIALLIFLFILSFIAIYLIGYYSEYLLAVILSLSFVIIAAYQPVTWAVNIERSGYLLVSGLIVASFYVLFMPNYLQWKLQITLRESLYSLQLLYDQIFVCMLAEDFVENNYVYERRLHIRKNNYLLYIRALKENSLKLKNPKTNEFYFSLSNKLDRLFDILEDCAQMRSRIKDHSTFQLCAVELIAIAQAIDDEFQAIIVAIENNSKAISQDENFQTTISSLEGNYQHILKTSATEPFLFLLFITNLKVLAVEFNEIQLLLPLTAK